MIDEILNQRGDIFPSFAQRRHLNRKNVEPVKQVATNGSSRDGRLQITIGSSNHANICLDGPSSADALTFAFLQNTQQSNLGLGTKLSDFLEEDRASCCEFEPAQSPLQRSGERALLMAKQFRGNQVARDCRAVDADKSARGAPRPPMDRARNKFLARSGFAGDQHGGVCGSHLGQKRETFLQGARPPDDLVAHRSLIDFFGQGDALVFESLFRLLWIRDKYCAASHELPPDLESLHLVRSLCSLRALWSLSRLRTTPIGVADSQLIRGAPGAYIKAGEVLLLGDRGLTLPKKPKWR